MSRPDPSAGPYHSPGRPGPHDPGHGARDPELAAILPGITGPGGQFRHRQHINLAFYAVRRYGMPDASARSAAGSGRSPRTNGRRRSTTTPSRGPGWSSADVIVIEDLAVRNMVRNRHLARAISDCGWGEFRRQLAYKCQRYGRNLIVIDRWYPSSKTCSACGHLLGGLSLGTRQWTCPWCRTRHDRDLNAAKNILAAGQAVTACGAGIRHSGTPRMRPAVKQEPRPVTTGIPVLQGGE